MYELLKVICMYVYMYVHMCMVYMTPNKSERELEGGGGGEYVHTNQVCKESQLEASVCVHSAPLTEYTSLFYKSCDFHTNHDHHAHTHTHTHTHTYTKLAHIYCNHR